MKIYTLSEVQDKIIGKKGTPARDKFEYELKDDNQEDKSEVRSEEQVISDASDN